MRPIVLCALLAALIACQSAERDPPRPGDGPLIAAEALLERIREGDAPRILDVRTEIEFASGHVEGALCIPHDRIANELAGQSWAKDDEIVVYCRSGRRAAIVEDYLREQGYTRIRHMEGDMLGWNAKGLPLIRP